MIELFDLVRFLSGAIWARLLVVSAVGVFRVLFLRSEKHRYYDVLRCGCFVIASNNLAFSAQWFIFRSTLHAMSVSEIGTRCALYLYAAFAGFIMSVALRVYERDCRDC